MVPLFMHALTGSGYSLILELILFAAFLAYVFYIFASRLDIKVLRGSAIMIYLCGVGLYIYGFSQSHAVEGVTTIILRSALSAVEMFVSNNDLLEIEEAQHQPFFLDIFIFVYACAVTTSISTMLSLFGKRAMTIFNLRINRRRGVRYRHIFFGLDSNSMYLAKNLDKDEHIAFIEFPSDEEAEKLSFGAIIQNMVQGIADKHGIEGKNISILKAKKKISDLGKGKDMLSQMGLGAIKPLTDDSTTFYILSDNTDKNIEKVLTLVTDPFFSDHTIQCSAHKGGLTEQFEKSLFGTHVHFFYRNTMGILSLREDKRYHPVNVATVAKDKDGNSLGYVEDKSIDTMIYGFGEGGKEAFKYLYQYASFVDRNGLPLPVRCYIQDSIIDKASGSFKAATPYLLHDEDIIYEKVSLLSDEYWKKIISRIDDLKIVFFCVADDKENLEAATKLLDYAMRHRKNGLKGLKVFVRIIEINDNMQAICNFYNWRAGAECLLLYGDRRYLFSPKWMVTNNSIGVSSHSANKAKEMYYSYYKAIEMEAPDWHERNDICNKARKDKDFPTLMRNVRFIRMYINSAYLSSTIAEFGKGHEELLRSIPVRLDQYQKLSSEKRKLIDKVSVSLHISWCRYMIFDGYVYGEKSDEIERKNRLIQPWAELSEEEKHQFRMNAKGMFIYLASMES